MINWIISNKLWLILGIGAAFNCFWGVQYSKKIRINGWIAMIFSLLHMIFAVLFARALAFMEGVPGGMSLYGGLFLLPILFILVAILGKRSVADVCDIITIPSIVTVACARMNCLFSGCCLGNEIPWAEGVRWPTREMELLLYVVLFIALRTKIGKQNYRGKLYPIYMISYGSFRFVIEWFREGNNYVGIFHLSHIWSIISIALGAMIIVLINNKIRNVDHYSKTKGIGKKGGKANDY